MSDIVQQLNLFSSVNPHFSIMGKKVMLIELFAGIGSQYKSLKLLQEYGEKQLGRKPFELVSHKICEWAYNSYVMYNLMHTKDFTDYSIGKTKEEMIHRIQGTSQDYNNPLSLEKLNKKPMSWIKTAYNSCIATNNLVDINNVSGRDLDFDNQENQVVILSYSFPCQDISGAGLNAGLDENSNTRSSLLWQVVRLLREREREQLPLPNILLMENVKALLNSTHIHNFKKLEQILSNMGYSNHIQILNTCDYGLPQHRERTFMISILGDYAYDFPRKNELKYCLLDLCDKNVANKFFLSAKMVKYITATNDKWTGNNNGAIVNKDIGCTINTRSGQRRCDASNYIAPELPPNTDLQKIKIKNATKQGYLEAEVGDGIDISSRMHRHRGTVQKGKTQTLNCRGGENIGVIIKDEK